MSPEDRRGERIGERLYEPGLVIAQAVVSIVIISAIDWMPISCDIFVPSRVVMVTEDVMKKLSLLGLLVVLAISPMLAMGCPKGTHPVGGTGSHHKGGTCQ